MLLLNPAWQISTIISIFYSMDSILNQLSEPRVWISGCRKLHKCPFLSSSAAVIAVSLLSALTDEIPSNHPCLHPGWSGKGIQAPSSAVLRLPLLSSAVFVISLFMALLSPFSYEFLFLMMPVSVQSCSVFMPALGAVLSPKQLSLGFGFTPEMMPWTPTT